MAHVRVGFDFTTASAIKTANVSDLLSKAVATHADLHNSSGIRVS